MLGKTSTRKLPAKEKQIEAVSYSIGKLYAKTGSCRQRKYGEIRERYMNGNGDHLLDTIPDSNIIVTNECFRHKLTHRKTWTSPNRNTSNHSDG